MKRRDKQRFNRQIKEETLELRNLFGNNDPTPYKAVKEIQKEFKKSL